MCKYDKIVPLFIRFISPRLRILLDVWVPSKNSLRALTALPVPSSSDAMHDHPKKIDGETPCILLAAVRQHLTIKRGKKVDSTGNQIGQGIRGIHNFKTFSYIVHYCLNCEVDRRLIQINHITAMPYIRYSSNQYFKRVFELSPHDTVVLMWKLKCIMQIEHTISILKSLDLHVWYEKEWKISKKVGKWDSKLSSYAYLIVLIILPT